MTPPTDALARLTAPFPLDVIDFKPQVLNREKTAAMAATYVDARAVAARLDEVFPFAWTTTFRTVHDGNDRFVVECTLTLRLTDGTLLARADVGESDNGDREASRHKTAYSDALKRAAVQFGVGRYLYDLPQTWADYDAEKKRWAPTGQAKLEREYTRLTGLGPRVASGNHMPRPQEAQEGPSAAPRDSQAAPARPEPAMGPQLRRELFAALGNVGLKYPSGTDAQSEKRKRYVRAFVWWALEHDMTAIPDSMTTLTAREASRAVHLVMQGGADLKDRFDVYLEQLREQQRAG